LGLFRREVEELRPFLLSQDVIYVGGGNTANMLAIWRVHGVDVILREAWEAGVILAGLSAGSLCWFEGGVTDSLGTSLRPMRDGLGLLSGSNCPHYDGEAQRRPVYQAAVASGALEAGYGADDGVALRYVGAELVEVVSEREGASAWRVSAVEGGGVLEERVEARRL
jgi:peptidase E